METIVVLIKQTFDTEEKILVTPQGIDEREVKFVINPYDEYALEEALRLKEKHGGRVIAVTCGGERSQEALRTALAIGADEAIRLHADELPDDSYAVASALTAVVEPLQPELLLAGLFAVDTGSGSVALQIAERLGLPHVSAATKVTLGTRAALGLDQPGDGGPANASGQASERDGGPANASGQASERDGSSANASGQASRRDGSSTNASGQASRRDGSSANASGQASGQDGSSANASGQASERDGSSTNASGQASRRDGSSANAANEAWGRFAGGLSEDAVLALVERDNEGDTETVVIPLPALITAQQGLNEPRYPSLPGIMKAKRKPQKIIMPDELPRIAEDADSDEIHGTSGTAPGGDAVADGNPQMRAEGEVDEQAGRGAAFSRRSSGITAPRTVRSELLPPPPRAAGKRIGGTPEEQAAALIEMLRTEAKVL